MFGIGRKSDALYGVLVDIDSGSVGVGIVKSDPNDAIPHILFSHRVYLHVSKNTLTKSDRMRQIREALFSASLILSKDGLQLLKSHDPRATIEKIFVTSASPWALTVARTVSYNSEDELKVTDSLIRDLVSSAEHEIEHATAESSIAGSLGLEIVERTTVDVRINDYSIPNPIGLKGKEIDLTHITGLISKELLGSIYEIQDKIFADTSIRAHTAMLVMYCVLRDVFPKLHSLTIVDVTAEATEIGIVENGALVETLYVPHGTHTIVQMIAGKTDRTPTDIISLLRAYTEGTLNQRANDEITEQLTAYSESIASILTDAGCHRTIPTTFVVTAQPQFAPLITSIIGDVAKRTAGEHTNTFTLPPEILEGIAKNDIDQDTFMTVAARFFHKLHGCGEIGTH